MNCKRCLDIITQAKKEQAEEAERKAASLLEELDKEEKKPKAQPKMKNGKKKNKRKVRRVGWVGDFLIVCGYQVCVMVGIVGPNSSQICTRK